MHSSSVMIFTVCTPSAAVIIVGFFDSTKFYCSSRDYFDAAHPGAETGYCVFVSEYHAISYAQEIIIMHVQYYTSQ